MAACIGVGDAFACLWNNFASIWSNLFGGKVTEAFTSLANALPLIGMFLVVYGVFMAVGLYTIFRSENTQKYAHMMGIGIGLMAIGIKPIFNQIFSLIGGVGVTVIFVLLLIFMIWTFWQRGSAAANEAGAEKWGAKTEKFKNKGAAFANKKDLKKQEWDMNKEEDLIKLEKKENKEQIKRSEKLKKMVFGETSPQYKTVAAIFDQLETLLKELQGATVPERIQPTLDKMKTRASTLSTYITKDLKYHSEINNRVEVIVKNLESQYHLNREGLKMDDLVEKIVQHHHGDFMGTTELKVKEIIERMKQQNEEIAPTIDSMRTLFTKLEQYSSGDQHEDNDMLVAIKKFIADLNSGNRSEMLQSYATLKEEYRKATAYEKELERVMRNLDTWETKLRVLEESVQALTHEELAEIHRVENVEETDNPTR